MVLEGPCITTNKSKVNQISFLFSINFQTLGFYALLYSYKNRIYWLRFKFSMIIACHQLQLFMERWVRTEVVAAFSWFWYNSSDFYFERLSFSGLLRSWTENNWIYAEPLMFDLKELTPTGRNKHLASNCLHLQ